MTFGKLERGDINNIFDAHNDAKTQALHFSALEGVDSEIEVAVLDAVTFHREGFAFLGMVIHHYVSQAGSTFVQQLHFKIDFIWTGKISDKRKKERKNIPGLKFIIRC